MAKPFRLLNLAGGEHDQKTELLENEFKNC